MATSEASDPLGDNAKFHAFAVQRTDRNRLFASSVGVQQSPFKRNNHLRIGFQELFDLDILHEVALGFGDRLWRCFGHRRFDCGCFGFWFDPLGGRQLWDDEGIGTRPFGRLPCRGRLRWDSKNWFILNSRWRFLAFRNGGAYLVLSALGKEQHTGCESSTKKHHSEQR